MKIEWKSGAMFKTDAEVAYSEVERIRAQHGGEITADDLVAEAKAKESPLHDDFEWNDKKAAHAHRLETARSMLRSITIVREETKSDKPQRVYEVVRVAKADEKPKNVYKSTEEIMADPETRAELLSRALRELMAIRTRYKGLQELAIVFRSLDNVLETIEL